jgi:DNA-binding phage protein
MVKSASTAAKVPSSDRYDEYLIESLKDPEEAAGFLEAILEEEEPEPELLRNALRKVVEARCRLNGFSENDKLLHGRLDKMLTESGCAEVYTFVELLDALGFKVAIASQP